MSTAAKALKLTIITPDAVVIDTSVESVVAVTEEGELGILPGHAPLFASLQFSTLRYTLPGGSKNKAAVMGGLLKTDGKTVTVMSNAAELSQHIDLLRAQEAKQRASAFLEASLKGDHIDEMRARLALQRALTRIRAKQG